MTVEDTQASTFDCTFSGPAWLSYSSRVPRWEAGVREHPAVRSVTFDTSDPKRLRGRVSVTAKDPDAAHIVAGAALRGAALRASIQPEGLSIRVPGRTPRKRNPAPADLPPIHRIAYLYGALDDAALAAGALGDLDTQDAIAGLSPDERADVARQVDAAIADLRSVRRRLTAEPRTCVVCGKVFLGRADAQTCSDAHRQELHRQRHA